jgi:pimeloyl-ACP methyl ester carboxylesterase
LRTGKTSYRYTICQSTKNNIMKNLKTSDYARVNGLNMYYEIYGEGKIPLVLIHGGGSTIESSFGNLLPELSDEQKIIAVELQAHGRTEDRPMPESFEQDADDVATLIKHLGIEKANFLGFSNGGTTTLQIAIRHPGVVNKIIVVCGAYRRDGFIAGFFEGFKGASLANMPQALKDDFLKVTPDTARLQVMFDKDVERMVNFKDIPDEQIQSISALSLIIANDRDVVTKEHTVKMSQQIPGASLIILPGIHGTCIGEVTTMEEGNKLPLITAMLIEEFLDK